MSYPVQIGPDRTIDLHEVIAVEGISSRDGGPDEALLVIAPGRIIVVEASYAEPLFRVLDRLARLTAGMIRLADLTGEDFAVIGNDPQEN